MTSGERLVSVSMDLLEEQSKVTSGHRSEVGSVKNREEGAPDFALNGSAVVAAETRVR